MLPGQSSSQTSGQSSSGVQHSYGQGVVVVELVLVEVVEVVVEVVLVETVEVVAPEVIPEVYGYIMQQCSWLVTIMQ